MLVAYLCTRSGRAFVGKLSIAALAFGFGAGLAQELVAGIPADPTALLREYDSGAPGFAGTPPVGNDFFVPVDATLPDAPGVTPDQMPGTVPPPAL